MKKITKGIIIVLAFLVMAFITTGSYLTNQMEWKGMRQTGNRSDAGAVILTETNITSLVTMKEWTTTITATNYTLTYTNVSDISFNGLLEHLIIQPNSSTVKWRFKLTDPESYIIYDATEIDQTGRMGLIVDLPLIGIINTTIQNCTENATFSIKVVYT